MQNSQASSKKISTKMFWRAGQARDWVSLIPCVVGRGDGNDQQQKLQGLEGFKACAAPARSKTSFILWI